ncbi:MAG: hypothetical protein R3279_01430 [Putridiphycobacter sp.]|nr:hypothetical protein [Putridiphycobacter sp.]
METTKSVKIIEQMLKESRQSLSKYSFHFILWALLLIPSALIEWYFVENPLRLLVWPIAGVIGGIIAAYYGYQQSKKVAVTTISDRVSGFIWGGFGICLLFSICYSIYLKVPPHTLILLLAGGATFTTGGLFKFRPFIVGGLFLMASAILCGFAVTTEHQSLIFALGLTGGYLVPGLMLRKIENA